MKNDLRFLDSVFVLYIVITEETIDLREEK